MVSKYFNSFLIGTEPALGVYGLAEIVQDKEDPIENPNQVFYEGESVPIVPYESKEGKISNKPYSHKHR